jgi:hypothetical protein
LTSPAGFSLALAPRFPARLPPGTLRQPWS